MEEYNLVCKNRIPLDESMANCVIKGVEGKVPDWREIALTSALRTKVHDSIKLVATVEDLQLVIIPVSAEIVQKLKEFQEFYLSHGFDLQNLDCRLFGSRKKLSREVEVLYS